MLELRLRVADCCSCCERDHLAQGAPTMRTKCHRQRTRLVAHIQALPREAARFRVHGSNATGRSDGQQPRVRVRGITRTARKATIQPILVRFQPSGLGDLVRQAGVTTLKRGRPHGVITRSRRTTSNSRLRRADSTRSYSPGLPVETCRTLRKTVSLFPTKP